MRKHKLSTDTGIEITIPTDYFENTDFVEFFKSDDGSMSITLKNIQNITWQSDKYKSRHCQRIGVAVRY